MVRINGEYIDIKSGTMISDYLKNAGFNLQRLAVEINGNIIPKKDYDTTTLNDGDKVEIVSFVGGG